MAASTWPVRLSSTCATSSGVPQATISIGLAVFDGELDIEELLHRADQALYAAKREGRNRLRMAA